MSKPYAGLRGPNYAWRAVVYVDPEDTDIDDFDFTDGELRMIITAHRPDGTEVEWDSDAGEVVFQNVTATSLVARHVYAIDGSDTPFIGTGKLSHYKFTFDLTLDGEAIELPAVCVDFYNKDAC